MSRSKRILVVDDEEPNRSLLEAMLDSFGYKAELASGGAEALEKLSCNIDLVLLDVLMPGLDGLEVTRRIRNRADCADIPIVIVTALTGKPDRLQAITAGANDFISKPIDKTELQVRLASLLKMKESQEALRHSERKYRTLVETAKDVIWTVDMDLRYTYVSPSVTAVLGYTVDEIMSMHPLDGFTPASRERVIRGFNEELALEAATPDDRHASRTEEIERYHKDGSTRWTEISMRFLRDDSGKPVGVMGISHDITARKRMENELREARDELEQRVKERTAELLRANEELAQEITVRKKAEEALLESEEKYRALFEGAAEGILVADVETRKLSFANPAILDMFGYTLEEMVQLSVSDIHPAASIQRAIVEFEALGREEKALVPNVPCLRKDGSVFYADIVGRPVVIEKRLMNVGFFSDITERKKAEDALRESEDRYRQITENSLTGIFIHQDGVGVYVNQRLADILDYTKEEMIGGQFLKVVHPEDREMVAGRASARLNDQLTPAVYELRLLRKTGETIWCEVLATRIEYRGRPALMGNIADITDRKKAETALRESEESFRSLCENSLDGVVLADGAGRLLQANKAACEMFGRTEPELMEVGRAGVVDLTDPRLPLLLEERCRTGQVRGELNHKRKDGSIFPVEFSSSLFRNANGELRATVIIRDITDRKKADEALQWNETLLRQMATTSPLAYFVVDNRTDDILYFNSRFCEIWGIERLSDQMQQKVLKNNDIIPECIPLTKDLEAFAASCKPLQSEENRPVVVDEIEFVDDRTIRRISTPLSDEMGRYYGRFYIFEDISDRKRGENLLRESESRYRSLFENSPDGILIAGVETKRFAYANPSVCRMLDYTPEELRALGVADIHPHDQLPQVMAEFEAQARGEKVLAPNIPCLRKDGTVFYADISTTAAVLDGRAFNVGFFRDITERKRAEEALRESEGKYRFLAEHASDVLWTVDLNMRTTYVSPSIEKVLGFAPEERMQQNLVDQLTAESFDIARQKLFEELRRESEQGILPDRSAVLELDFVHKNGSIVSLESVIRFIRDATGAPIGCHGLSRDITERKRVKQERETLKEQLFQAQKMETIGTLTGGIAHDLNNLLTITNGYTELILSEKTEEDPSYSDLQRILETGRKGAEMVQRLLAFSKKAEISLQALNLNLTAENSVKLMQRTFPKMIEIETTFAKDLSQVNGDEVQVEQILMNLCINAKEAMPDGGRLRVETRNITVDEVYCRRHVGANPGPHVLIEVADTGEGIDAETLGRIYDPFFTTKGWDFKKGTGLGLSVTKGIVEQHGGWITCESELGKGTTFRIYFPAIEGLLAVDEPELGTAKESSLGKILLVDDEEYVRDLGKTILERSGYTVITASNGKDALDCYARDHSLIALVVLDLIMPQMGGEKCLEELLKVNPQARVIVSTGYSLDLKERDHFAAYVKGFVNKPYKMKQFLEVVAGVLDAK